MNARTVTTTEELAALPTGSIVRQYEGYVTIKYWTDSWFLAVNGSKDRFGSDSLELPATVLYDPSAA